jgi:preprotein translocase subunit SecE
VAEVKQDNRLVRYFKETRAEVRKVHWPTRKEAQNLTIIVLVITIIMTIFLGLIVSPLALWLSKGILIDQSTLQILIGLVLSVVGLIALVIALRRQ